MNYISNAFSLGMIPANLLSQVRLESVEAPSREVLNAAISCVGHQNMADIIGIPMNRVSIQLQEGDRLYVCQYKGQRLAEGATSLPPNSKFDWVLVWL